jgi:hypothetical protein
MTEELWLKSRDLKRLFAHLGRPTQLVQDPHVRRRYRLFGVAAVAHAWSNFELPPILRQALDVAERFADGNATASELQSVRQMIQRNRALAPFSLAACCIIHDEVIFAGYDAAEHAFVEAHGRSEPDAVVANSMANAQFFRDIFGNPFRPVIFNPDWHTSTAVALAEGMYNSRDFSAMPILADALEDAGCDSEDILQHCREPNVTHVRGCWVVDLVLGKV